VRTAFLALIAAFSLSGCEADPGPPFDGAACERGEEGQVRCLVSAFEAQACSEARVVGAMRRSGEAGFQHYTAYTVSPECFERLQSAAEERGFVQSPDAEDQWVARFDARYGEKLEFDANGESTTVVWERIQE